MKWYRFIRGRHLIRITVRVRDTVRVRVMVRVRAVGGRVTMVRLRDYIAMG